MQERSILNRIIGAFGLSHRGCEVVSMELSGSYTYLSQICMPAPIVSCVYPLAVNLINVGVSLWFSSSNKKITCSTLLFMIFVIYGF